MNEDNNVNLIQFPLDIINFHSNSNMILIYHQHIEIMIGYIANENNA